MISYFEILQLPQNASPGEIQASYTKLSHQNKDNLKQLHLLDEAYNTLINDTKRERYLQFITVQDLNTLHQELSRLTEVEKKFLRLIRFRHKKNESQPNQYVKGVALVAAVIAGVVSIIPTLIIFSALISVLVILF